MSLYYPMMLKIKDKPCTVVGGGSVAERKVTTLLEYEAIVTVISPKLTEGLQLLRKKNKIFYINKYYEAGDLTGSYLVYAATDDESINKKCRNEAEAHHILINVGDSPELSDFILPATIKRGSLTIAVSTEGKSPALSRKIREELESLYGEVYSEVLDTLGEIREKALEEISSPEDRKKLFHQLVYGVLNETALKGEKEELNKNMWEVYKNFTLKKA